MALGSDEATFNAAVDTLWAAWETFYDTLSANEEIQICFVRSKSGSLAADSTQGTDASDSAKFDTGRKYYWTNNPNTADNGPLEIAGIPLFWKVTNAAGDLT